MTASSAMIHQPDVAPVCFCCSGAQRRRSSHSGPSGVEAGRHAWDAASNVRRATMFAAFRQTVSLNSPDRSFTARSYSFRVTAAVKCQLSSVREPATMKASSFSTKGWTLSS